MRVGLAAGCLSAWANLIVEQLRRGHAESVADEAAEGGVVTEARLAGYLRQWARTPEQPTKKVLFAQMLEDRVADWRADLHDLAQAAEACDTFKHRDLEHEVDEDVVGDAEFQRRLGGGWEEALRVACRWRRRRFGDR